MTGDRNRLRVLLHNRDVCSSIPTMWSGALLLEIDAEMAMLVASMGGLMGEW